MLLVVVTMITTLVSSIVAKADVENSNDRRKYMLEFAQNKDVSSIEDVESLTYEDLRMIGLFLSNFYIPFNTGVGETFDDDSVKEQMAEALVSSAGFDSEIAKVLVESIFSMSVSTRKPLSIANGTVDGVLTKPTSIVMDGGANNSDVVRNTIDSEGVDATLYTFFGCMAGGFDKDRNVQGKYVDSETDGDERFYLYWKDESGKDRIIWEMDKGSNGKDIEFTSCTASYMLMMDDANYKLGLGGNALLSVAEETYEKFTEKNRDEVLFWNADLFVDCFGNILCDVGTQLYVVVPACNNPYAWYSVESGVESAGKNMQLLNFFHLGEIKAGNIVNISKDFSVDSDGFPTVNDNGGSIKNYQLFFSNANGTLYNIEKFRITRDNTITALDRDFGWWNVSELKEQINNTNTGLQYSSFSEGAYFPNFKTYADSVVGEKAGVTFPKKTLLIEKSNIQGAFSDFLMIDTYNEFSAKNDITLDALPRVCLFQEKDGEYHFIDSSISTGFAGVDIDNTITKISASDKKWVVSIYLSYLYAYSNAVDGENGKISYAFNKDAFPNADSGSVDFSSIIVSEDGMQKELTSMVYYLIHPVKGVKFIAEWVANKVGGVLVDWHERMVGNSSSNSSTGATKYLGFTGYVTLPSLTDLSWTAKLLDIYYDIYLYLVVIVCIVLIISCFIGELSVTRAILGSLSFMFIVMLPPIAVNTSVTTINRVSDSIYGKKFNYWALVQHQSFIKGLNDSVSSGNKSNYLSFLFNEQGVSEDEYRAVKVKWMAPKKDNILSNVIADANKTSSVSSSLTLMNKALKDNVSGESFSTYSDALYLYRDYSDLYMYVSRAYRTDVNQINPVSTKGYFEDDATRHITYSNGEKLFTYYNNRGNISKEDSMAFAQEKGFLVDTGYDIGSSNKSYSYLIDSYVGVTLQEQKDRFSKFDGNINYKDLSKSTFGIANESYEFTIANINTGQKSDGSNISSTSSEDQKKMGYFYYGLYSESPFYYFTWNIYDQANSKEFGLGMSEISKENVIELYTKDNQGYFFNYSEQAGDGFGELRDFNNMRGLFYYVIPYLKNCNELVESWSDVYGLKTYEDVRLEYESDGETVIIPNFDDKTDEYKQKWWHNYNVERLFNVYVAWVDTLYDCDYAKPETISVVGKDYRVTDPLNPMAYYKTDSNGNIIEGRYMVFSRSEMKYWGLNYSDLTKVEQKIIEVQDNVYKELFQLMDYYTFNDDVLVTSAGMLTTFEFNKAFSQTSLIKESFVLYPQSYELKTFSYDAYLRLILSQSTNENLLDTSNGYDSGTEGQLSFYQRIVNNSSITTAILLIILDIVAVYLLPALKVFFLVSIFLMSIIMLVLFAIRQDGVKKNVFESLVKPLVQFSIVSIGLAVIVSFFMSSGNTAVTGRDGVKISLGDPSMVLIVMIVINAVALYLYVGIVKSSINNFIRYTKALFSTMVDVMSSFGGMAVVGIGSSVVEGRGIGNVLSRTAPRVTNRVAKGRDTSNLTPRVKENIEGNKGDNQLKGVSNSNRSLEKESQELKRAKNRLERLQAGGYSEKAKEFETARNIRQKQKEANLKRIKDKEAEGKKLRLSEQMYKRFGSKVDGVKNVRDGLIQRKYDIQSKVIKGTNTITGRVGRAQARYEFAKTKYDVKADMIKPKPVNRGNVPKVKKKENKN